MTPGLPSESSAQRKLPSQMPRTSVLKSKTSCARSTRMMDPATTIPTLKALVPDAVAMILPTTTSLIITPAAGATWTTDGGVGTRA